MYKLLKSDQRWPENHVHQQLLSVWQKPQKAGIVSKELRELECLLHVHLYTGATLVDPAG